ncbi:MAG TPA: TonB family protein [Thermoanaerobaculia bacterium]|nr:TonB family protein [Thermoanaerobaculia bacterium]
MEDRVGDILAQRARLESGAGAAIFLSVLFHATLTAIAGWSAWHHASTTATPVMMIRFAKPAPVITPAAPAAPHPAATPQPQPKVIEQPKPVDKKKFAPPSPFGKSSKKAAENPQPQPRVATPAPAPPAAAPAAQEVPVGGSGVSALDTDFPYPLYIEQMKRLIGSHWARPASNDQATATIHFVVERDGTVRDANTELPSGNGSYDRAALRAVLESSPLPPLPFAYNGTYLGVHLKFR